MKFISLISILITFIVNASPNLQLKTIQKCEEALKKQQQNKIVKTCLNLDSDSSDVQVYKIVAELFVKVPYKRINEIFGYTESDPLTSEMLYKKKLYSNIDKYYLTEAYDKLKVYSNFKIDFVSLVYAKIAYINIMYFQIREGGILNSNTLDLEKKLVSEIYIPHLEKYISSHSNDKEVLYLLGIQGVDSAFPLNSKSYNQYFKIINFKYFKYLEESANLGFYKAINALNQVENWNKYLKNQRRYADKNDKEALYELGMQNFYNYIENGNKDLDSLEKAISDLDKSQFLGHKEALSTLINIYARYKPNKEKYTTFLKKIVVEHGEGFLPLGNVYWCNGDKVKAKEMYLKAKAKGGILVTEAEYFLQDLNKLDKPYDGCIYE